jgi:hypothetical protein
MYILNKTLYIRPIEFFLLIALISGVIGIEILTLWSEKTYFPYIILIKIIILSFILRWSLYYIFPGSYLGADPWNNGVLFTNIAEKGYLNPLDMGGYYFNPFEHLLVVNIIHLTGLNSLNSMIFSLTLIEAVSVIFIYLIGNQLFNRKVGLLAALLLAVNNIHIWWGWWPVAQTFGIVLFAMILWKIVKIHTQNNLKYKLILIFFFVSIVFTHSVSTFVTFITMGLYLVGYYIYNLVIDPKEKINHDLFLLLMIFTLIILAHWIYYAADITSFVRMFFGEQDLSITYQSSASVIAKMVPISELINKLCSLLFYGFSIFGILILMNEKIINKYRFSYAIAGIFLLGILFLNFFLPISTEILIGRWFVFCQIMLAISAGLGVLILLNLFSGNSAKVCTIFILLFTLSFFMTTNTLASFDSPLYPNYLKDRVGLKESEIQATDTISSFKSGNIRIDNLGARAMIDNFAHLDKSKIPVKNIEYSDIVSDFTVKNDLIIIRNAMFSDTIIVNNPEKGVGERVILKNVFSGNSKNKFQKIYDTNSAFAVIL